MTGPNPHGRRRGCAPGWHPRRATLPHPLRTTDERGGPDPARWSDPGDRDGRRSDDDPVGRAFDDDPVGRAFDGPARRPLSPSPPGRPPSLRRPGTLRLVLPRLGAPRRVEPEPSPPPAFRSLAAPRVGRPARAPPAPVDALVPGAFRPAGLPDALAPAGGVPPLVVGFRLVGGFPLPLWPPVARSPDLGPDPDDRVEPVDLAGRGELAGVRGAMASECTGRRGTTPAMKGPGEVREPPRGQRGTTGSPTPPRIRVGTPLPWAPIVPAPIHPRPDHPARPRGGQPARPNRSPASGRGSGPIGGTATFVALVGLALVTGLVTACGASGVDQRLAGEPVGHRSALPALPSAAPASKGTRERAAAGQATRAFRGVIASRSLALVNGVERPRHRVG